MRTLVLGGTGLLGSALTAEGRRRRWPVLALSRAQADIRDRDALDHFVADFRPELIVNCAALTAVDACESREEEAMEINGRAVAKVVAAARTAGAALLQVSTDYVFDGEADEPYPEDAPIAPRSVYGRSKALGEAEAGRYPEALVVRTSWLFGPGGPNFVATMVRLLEGGQTPLEVVADQVGCPTYAPFLARTLWELAARRARGVLHVRHHGPVSWYEFAVAIARDWNGATEVEPIATAETGRPAPRPAYSVLDVGRVESLLGHRLEPWRRGLDLYLESLNEHRGEGVR